MKILAVHNRYLHYGGEDVIFDAETALLTRRGHEVVRFVTDNADVATQHPAALAMRTIWNPATVQRVSSIIRREHPEIVHVHNTLPLISPSVYGAAHKLGVPVIQTLHNFRLLCPGALLLRNGAPCEACVNTVTRWPGVMHACYRNSRAATATVAAMLTTHTLLGTWRHDVDRYIALSEFAMRKFVGAGWPEPQFVVQPNFVETDPGFRPADAVGSGRYVLYVGRVSAEKGIRTLLEAWRQLCLPMPLKIAGTGPLVPRDTSEHNNVEWLGHQSREHVNALMRGAALVVVPSECFETSPLALIEAFAIGAPVIASRLGAMAEMVTDGDTGRLFAPGDAADLARTIGSALRSPGQMAQLAARARLEFERKYTADTHYSGLIRIYHEAIDGRRVQNTGNALQRVADRDRGTGSGHFRAGTSVR